MCSITTVRVQNIFISSKRNPVHISGHFAIPPLPPLSPEDYYSVSLLTRLLRTTTSFLHEDLAFDFVLE